MGGAITLHSRFNRASAVALWALAAFMLARAVMSDDPRAMPLYPGGALIALFAWAALWRPYVRVDDDGVTVRNVTHSVTVPWAALVHVDTRYALTLRTPGGAFAAWAAPAPGLIGSIRANRAASNREARASGEALRAGDLLGTESGNAATVVREQWRSRVDRGLIAIGDADSILVRRRWDLPTVTAFVVLAVVTLWTLIATG